MVKSLRRFGLCTYLLLSTFIGLANAQSILPQTEITSTLIERGTGKFRRFGFHIYNATLWTQGDNLSPPYALQLTYTMNIKAKRIVSASIDEMQTIGATDQQLTQWKNQLDNIIPNVKKGDTITGIHTGTSAEFYLNRKHLGNIDSKDFAVHFFGIWLSDKTSDPQFQRKLVASPQHVKPQ